MSSFRRSTALAVVFVLSSVVATDAVAQEGRTERIRQREVHESVRERVDASLRRSQEVRDRLDENRYWHDDMARLGVDIQERVREALRRADIERFNSDSYWFDRDRLFSDNARDRVWDARERAQDFRFDARTWERAEEVRARAMDRAFRDMDRLHDLDDLRTHLDGRVWNSLDAKRFGDEVRERVRESIENARRVEERANRRWY